MIGHYVLMSVITFIAFGAIIVLTAAQDLAGQASSGLEYAIPEILDKARELLFANSELISLVSQIVSVGIVVLIFGLKRRKNKDDETSAVAYFSLKKVSPTMLIMCALLAFCAYFAVNAFVMGVNIIFSLQPDETEATFSVISVLTLVVGAPICEELIYRNMAITNMNKRLAPILSILISSAIFGVVHGSPIQMIYAGALGFLFGVLFVRTESIFPSLLAHSVFNAMGYGLPLLAANIEVDSSAESVFNLTVVILTVVSALLIPLIIWWVLRHTDRPLCVKSSCAEQGAGPAWMPYPPHAPYPPQNPPYGYPPQGYQPPYAPPFYQTPPPPQGWIFDPRYGWIFVGVPPRQPNANDVHQNSPAVDQTTNQSQSDSSNETGEKK